MSKVGEFVVKQLDAIVYGIIGPFSVCYVIPKFFLDLQTKLGIQFQETEIFKYTGIFFMNFGALIAVWSMIVMHFTKKASVSPFTPPKMVITHGPFKYVRHPMMWAINFVMIGEIFAWRSPMVFMWFLIWIRFSVIYIARHEEPYLVSVFGEEYLAYCKKTPRWFMKL